MDQRCWCHLIQRCATDRNLKTLAQCFLATWSVSKADFAAGFHTNPLNPDRTDFSARHTDFFFLKNPQLLLSLPYCLESPVLQLFVFEEKMLEEWLDTEKLTSNKDARLFLIFKLLIRKRLKSLNWHLECNMSKQAPRENDSNLVICKNIAKNPRLAPKI